MKAKIRSKFDDYLKERGMTKTFIAKKINATNAMVSRWCQNDENGQAVSTPSTVYMLRIEKLLDCRIGDLYEEVE